MNTFTQIYYHIIFSTKNRTKSLEKEKRDQLFKYIWGILKNKRCHLYRINGIEDHIHIFTHLHPTIPLASLVKDIKLVSTDFIKKEALFLNFNGWNGYAAFTVTIKREVPANLVYKEPGNTSPEIKFPRRVKTNSNP